MITISLVLGFVAAVLGGAQAWRDSNCAEGRVAMVHLFEWTWRDVAAECERFLGPMGYCGVQVSPAHEHAMITPPESNRPWWESYQPISYKLHSRRGDEAAFTDMVQRCNNVGVRVYVDIILNHMCGMGRAGVGTGGSSYDSDEGSFPGVPFTMDHFYGCSQCPGCCCINSWTDIMQVRECRLVGLIDMDQTQEYVRQKQADYLNHMIDIGVAGFRVDAAKHMYPEDLEAIWGRLNNLNSQWFPSGSKPFMFLEVIDMDQGGEVRSQWYTHLGRVTEFRFCVKVKNAASALWDVPYLYDPGWGMVAPEEAFTFVDNHDNQRGHGGGGDILTHKQPREYKIAQAISLSTDYGFPRVMSSYDFEGGDDPPPMHDDGSTMEVPINDDGSCGNGWICEHRWKAIAGMAGWSKAASGASAENFQVDGNEIGYSRGNKAFIAITNKGGMDKTFYTGLPAGSYCNVIQGCPTSSGCEGDTINVDGSGNAQIRITNSDEPMAAIHVEAMAGSKTCNWGDPGNPGPVPTPSPTPIPPETTTSTSAPGVSTTTTTISPTTPTPGPTPPPGRFQRTIIFLRAQTNPGNDLFYRGGINHDSRPGCTDDATTSTCAIDIRHNDMGSGSHYEAYNAWKVGDTKFDWYGAQRGQGTHNGQTADGTPAVWTTNDQSHPGFNEYNIWGEHFWAVDFMMDCTQTEDGWFELKTIVTGWGWEGDIYQDQTCDGTAGGSKPIAFSNNHVARCGYVNAFWHNSPECTINNF